MGISQCCKEWIHCGAVVLGVSLAAVARVPYPVDATYADTVRIAILSNDFATGECGSMPFVGPATRDFVVAALDSTHIRHMRVTPSPTATVDTLVAMFPGKLPHVLVHINAGWAGHNGLKLPPLLTWAVQHNIGIVEIGDDDAVALGGLFPWVRSDTAAWAPMNTGMWLMDPSDTLSIRLTPGSDRSADSVDYPYLNGLIRNAALKVRGDSTLYFKQPGGEEGRCEADPDQYVINADAQTRVMKLAYQQGFNRTCDTVSTPGDGTCDTIVAAPWDYTCITVLQDTIDIGTTPGRRRAVSLSFQPQFLQDSIAARQVVYDAVMYASLVHVDNPAGVRQQRLSQRDHPSTVDRVLCGDIRIVDMAGRTVFAGDLATGAVLRHLVRGLRRGVYVVHATWLGKTVTRSFAISH